jgi:ABC-type transporter Mla subunit MlaD
VRNYQNEIGFYLGQVSYLTTEVSNLRTQVNQLYAVIDLSNSYVPGPAQTMSVPPYGNVTFLTFTEGQAGYVVVNLSATSDLKNAGFIIFNGYDSQVIKGVPDFVSVPVIPGPVTVYLLNTGPDKLNMTISVSDVF